MTMKDQITDLIKTQAVQTEILERVEDNIKYMKSQIVGNGKTGLLTRVDRLERWGNVKNKFLWIVAGGIFAVFISWVKNLL